MKANELRIGNLIKVEGVEKPMKVFIIDTTETSIMTRCKPIPLTKEWLLKFGYDLMTENNYAISGHLIWKCNDLLMCDKNGIVLKHVHQLQNLYFALTGEELVVSTAVS